MSVSVLEQAKLALDAELDEAEGEILKRWQQHVQTTDLERKKAAKKVNKEVVEKGGPGSGNFGHAGRPGKVGGSVSGGGLTAPRDVDGNLVGSPSNTISQEDFKSDGATSTETLMDKVAEDLASKWDVDDTIVAALLQEELSVGAKIPDNPKKALTSLMLRQWAGSSGGALQQVAIDGVATKLGLTHSTDLSDVSDWLDSNIPGSISALHDFGNIMYADTQTWLAGRNIKHLNIIRNGASGEDRLHTSWSLSWGGVRHEAGKHRGLVEISVPIKYVMSVPSTGFGTLAESEVVLLPRNDDAAVISKEVTDTTCMIAWTVPLQVAEQLRSEHMHIFPSGDLTPATEMHVTLKYLGDVEDDSMIAWLEQYTEQLAAETASFDIAIESIGRFDKVEDGTVDAVYLTANSPVLHDLKIRIERDIGHVRQDDIVVYTPHITLAYVPTGTEYEAAVVPTVVPVNYLTFARGGVFKQYPMLNVFKEQIVEKQLPIDDDSKNVLLKVRMNIFNDESDRLAEQVFNGDITIGQWQDSMKALIKGAHTSTAAIGKGGWDVMGPRDWGRIGTPVRNQYKFLAGFADTLDEKRDVMTLKYIQNRARLYGEAIVQSAVMAEAGFWFSDHLPYLPRDGSTRCLMRCHCHWSLKQVEDRGTFVMVEAVWHLGEADHCETCVSRDGHTEIIKVPYDVTIPEKIGGF